jgi:hypothetical protein
LFDPRYRSGATSSLIAAAAPIEPQAPLPIAAALPIVQQVVEEISLAVDESMDPEDVDVDKMGKKF